MGAHPPGARAPVEVTQRGTWSPSSSGEASVVVTSLLFVCLCARGVDSDWTWLCPSCQSQCGLFFFFLNFILFLNLKHCISFAKHQNESAPGSYTLIVKNLLC